MSLEKIELGILSPKEADGRRASQPELNETKFSSPHVDCYTYELYSSVSLPSGKRLTLYFILGCHLVTDTGAICRLEYIVGFWPSTLIAAKIDILDVRSWLNNCRIYIWWHWFYLNGHILNIFIGTIEILQSMNEADLYLLRAFSIMQCSRSFNWWGVIHPSVVNSANQKIMCFFGTKYLDSIYRRYFSGTSKRKEGRMS